MNLSRTENASRNIAWGVLYKVVSLGLPFVTRTVLIYTLGMQYVGLGSIFSSILQVLSFAELGIGSALVFGMYKPMAEGNDEKVCALLNFYKKTYRIIGTIILVFGLLMMPFLKYLIAGDIPETINLQVLFSIYLLNNIIGYFLYAYKQSLFTASQRTDMISKIGMGLQLFSSVAQIFVLAFVHNYYLWKAIVKLWDNAEPVRVALAIRCKTMYIKYYGDALFTREYASQLVSEYRRNFIPYIIDTMRRYGIKSVIGGVLFFVSPRLFMGMKNLRKKSGKAK